MHKKLKHENIWVQSNTQSVGSSNGVQSSTQFPRDFNQFKCQVMMTKNVKLKQKRNSRRKKKLKQSEAIEYEILKM